MNSDLFVLTDDGPRWGRNVSYVSTRTVNWNNMELSNYLMKEN